MKRYSALVPAAPVFAALALTVLVLVSCDTGDSDSSLGDPVVGVAPQQVEDELVEDPSGIAVSDWVTGLEVPWALAFLPDGRALVTERPGRLRLIEGGTLVSDPLVTFDVRDEGEGGLMGVAVHPDFPDRPFIYVMYTYEEDGRAFNRVERLREQDGNFESQGPVVERIPGAGNHNGGRIAFGPDGMLYVTTGDAGEPELAQDTGNLAGAILRFTPDGGIPEDNPFGGSPVWAYGFRNPQGLAWEPGTGELFAADHGPTGEFGLRDRDEINVVERGANCGWPLVVGDADVAPYVDPIIMWERATPPAGMTFHGERLFAATLRSRALLRIDFSGTGSGREVASIERWFASDWESGRYGRLRDVVEGPDGALYVLTSNRDGRGNPAGGDDRILRIETAE